MRQQSQSLAIGLLLGLVSASLVSSQVASRKRVFTDRTRELARRSAGDAGDFYGRLSPAYEAVVALDSVDSLQNIDKAQLCRTASHAFTDAMQLEEAYQATQILSRLRCLDAKSSSAAAEVAVQHLATADSVLAAYHSISILSILHQSKTLPESIQAHQVERIIHMFKNFSNSQGAFKSSSSAKRSILATGLVYQTLADARALDINLSDETEGVVEEIRASLAQVLKVNRSGEAALALSGDEDKLQAASQLIIGAAAIYDGSATSISASQLSSAAQLLGGAFHVGSLADAAAVGPALKALTSSALPQPLLATLTSPRIKASQQDTVGVTVMDAWGQPSSLASITVHSSPLDATGKAQAERSNQTLHPGSSRGEYLYSTAHLHSHPGTYSLTVDMEASGGAVGQSQLVLTVSDEVQLDSISLAFSEGESQAALNETLPYPQALVSKSATLDPSQTLKVTLVMSAKHSGRSVVPQQRMLRFTSVANKAAAAYFNLKPSKVQDNSYTIILTPNNLQKQTGSQDGAYNMDVLIGDIALDVPVIWPLGTVAVSHHSSDESQTSLTAVGALFRPKPEIVHLQRTPGPRPLSIVSVFFTALALAPLLLLYFMLSAVGANLKGFPKDGAGRVAAMAFHGGIISIMGLYTLFWLKLNVMQTLPWLLTLGIFTSVAGYNALSHQADTRLKQQ